MARLIYSRRALADLESLVAFLMDDAPGVAAGVVDLVAEAVSVLARHPLVGREVEEGQRELVISRGRTGYLALYEFLEDEDVVLVLAVRHQREAGYGAYATG